MIASPQNAQALSTFSIGRMFVHPLFDYLLIGGGLSLLVTGVVCLYPQFQSLGNLTVQNGGHTVGWLSIKGGKDALSRCHSLSPHSKSPV